MVEISNADGFHRNRSLGLACAAKFESKVGSLQELVENNESAADYGTAMFPVEEVHKVGILDLHIVNLDRNDESFFLLAFSLVKSSLAFLFFRHFSSFIIRFFKLFKKYIALIKVFVLHKHFLLFPNFQKPEFLDFPIKNICTRPKRHSRQVLQRVEGDTVHADRPRLLPAELPGGGVVRLGLVRLAAGTAAV